MKKNGAIRLCVDLGEPNKAVVIDWYPLPHMEEMFAELRGGTLFSTLDLQSAYHQVVLHENSRDLTAFIKDEGLFRNKWIHYALASAPSCFQRMMCAILKTPTRSSVLPWWCNRFWRDSRSTWQTPQSGATAHRCSWTETEPFKMPLQTDRAVIFRTCSVTYRTETWPCPCCCGVRSTPTERRAKLALFSRAYAIVFEVHP